MEETESVSSRDKEGRFARELQRLLEEPLRDKYTVHVGKSLLYKLEVDVNGELRPKAEELRSPKRGQFAFQTDILIEKAEPAIPLVVVEFGGFSTHDIITYSSKATRHKEIYPYLRYGFVVGGSDALSKKFLTHNQGVDFAMSIADVPTDRKRLIDLVKRQIGNAEIEVRTVVRISNTEVVIALVIAGMVNMAMVMMASSAFHAGHATSLRLKRPITP
jgi:hypothetical protein